MKRSWPIGRRPIGDLGHLHFRHARMGVAQHLRDRQEEAPFELALPHLDRRLFDRLYAEQVRLWPKRLDITADGDRFGDPGPVVEFENRNGLERIQRREFWSLVLELAEIDLDARDRYALFRQEDAHAARARRQVGVVELHA